MDNFIVSAKAIHLKTYMPRTDSEEEASRTIGFVKMVAEDGKRFDAHIGNLDPLFKLGRNKQAIFELSDDPFNPEHPGTPTITNIIAR